MSCAQKIKHTHWTDDKISITATQLFKKNVFTNNFQTFKESYLIPFFGSSDSCVNFESKWMKKKKGFYLQFPEDAPRVAMVVITQRDVLDSWTRVLRQQALDVFEEPRLVPLAYRVELDHK
jgi:hypothetical protein